MASSPTLRVIGGKTKKSKILVVDDHPMVRDQLRAVIESQPDLTVCGEADTPHDALEVVQAARPDLVIVDLSLKGGSGLGLIKEILRRRPKPLILVVSMHDESLYAERAIHAGARGYITKQEATKKVLQAIRQVLAGDVYLGEKMATTVLTKVAGRGETQGRQSIERLTDREVEVFKLIGYGRTTQQIADELHLGSKTIDTYRSRIKLKLDLKDATELLQEAILWAHCGDTSPPSAGAQARPK